ncbi:MAG: hypothetical protein CR979_03340 [Propionibacterium sp.]|nr:MAG: hypothetical protein CR979_03340 [Propionibacterium sp.]
MKLPRFLVLLVSIVLLASGCSAQRPQTPPIPSYPPPQSIPYNGATLAELGYKNGPANFHLPANLQILERVDQPNVVTLITEGSDAELIANYLRANLAEMGYQIIGDKDNSLVFKDDHYDGAFTVGNGIAGLTLRLVER